MTGNLVLIGLSASSRNGTLALHSGVSLAGYMAGTLVGARICRSASTHGWPPGAVAALGVELTLLAAVAVVRGAVAGSVPSPLEVGLLVGTAGAMGLQSALCRVAPVPRLSTTYLTGALTEVVASLATGKGLAGQSRTLAVLGAAVLGAGAGAALVTYVPRAGAVPAVVAVATVLLLMATGRAGDETVVREETG
jgi:uncharacterized membrane protein YoaK (UPF0700 family)